MADDKEQVTQVIDRHRDRLRNFIRRHVGDPLDAQDVLQDVFHELLEANRLLVPIEHVAGWLFRAARNRIIDLLRKKTPERFGDLAGDGEDDVPLAFEDLLPSPDLGPEALHARDLLLEALCLGLEQLPPEQRLVFVAHELEGRSFKELSAETGVGQNTLLSRKRYAVIAMRARLQDVWDEFEETLRNAP